MLIGVLEEKRMEHNGLFHFSMDNALEIVIIFDENGIIKYANNEAKKRLEYDDLTGVDIATIFPGVFKISDGIVLLDNGFFGELIDIMAYRRNQTCFPVKGKCICNDGRYICMAYDVSNSTFLEKKISQVDKEAKDAMKVKTEFVANVTHELRTPVNGILGNTRELIELEKEPEKLKLLGLVERSCKDMNSIINNILDFSKLEAGKFVLEPREFNFRNMIDYIKGNHKNRIVEKGLEFSVSISPDIPETIIGDKLRIVQVLNNLISNAYKFTSVGRIHVEVVKTARSGNRMELFIMVRDTGIGISKADQDKLFKSFSQVDASISRKYGGTGLGLNICKQLVELMGGNIHVESDKGKGSVFSFGIWVEVPYGQYNEDTELDDINNQKASGNSDRNIIEKLKNLNDTLSSDNIWKYGEKENTEEIEKKMSKLILCMEMENWEKAEMFAESVKQLVAEAPREVQSGALRLKMAVQKGDYEKSMAAYEKLQALL